MTSPAGGTGSGATGCMSDHAPGTIGRWYRTARQLESGQLESGWVASGERERLDDPYLFPAGGLVPSTYHAVSASRPGFTDSGEWLACSTQPKKMDIALARGSAHREYGLDLAAITALWIAMAALVMPVGDFPLNDDWVYALGVKSLLEKAYFALPSTTSANVGPQIFWGALFCLPFGFSFTALRFSTLVLGLAGVWALYAVVREVTGDRRVALIGSLALAVNPLYFGLANSFMTDVPFISLEMIALYFFVRGLKRASGPSLALGIVISLLAILIRQFGILLVVAFAVAYIIRKGVTLVNLAKVAALVASAILLHVVYREWLVGTGRTTPVLDRQHQAKVLLQHFGVMQARHTAIITFLYVGLFVLPFVAALVPHGRDVVRAKCRRRYAGLLFFVGSLLLFGVLVWRGWSMPSTGNVLIEHGLGPLTLRDIFILELNVPAIPAAWAAGWLLVMFVAIVAGGGAIYYAALATRNALGQLRNPAARPHIWPFGLAASFLGLYLALMLAMSTKYEIFDRYLVVFVPFMLLLASALKPQSRALRPAGVRASIVVLVLYGMFSVMATHDYLEWNRNRWRATNDLMRDGGVTADRIDGGYEFNGWLTYDPAYRKKEGKSWWWVVDDEYVIASGPLPGYTEISRYSFRRWLMPTDSSVVVLRRSSLAGTQ